MDASFSSIPNAIEFRDGLPRPNWPAIFDWVDANIEDGDLDDACTLLARDWLNRLIQALPSGYAITESSNFFLVSNSESRLSDRLIKCCEHARLAILTTLAGVARDEGYGKHVVIAFGDTDRYYDYIADFYPDEGEFALSGGMFLDHGYGHFVICMACGDEHERIIAHELNHALLRHLPLPLWLNEGVTQVMEDTVVGNSYFIVNHETVRKHRNYWNSSTIHTFWSGESFFAPDDGQDLSYQLSQVLFRNLMCDFPQRIPEFLNKANYMDAGDSALHESCGVSLGDCVRKFLGDGEWNPRADYTSS